MKRAFLAFLRNPYVQIVFKYGLGILLLASVIAVYWDQKQDGQQVGISAVLERSVSWSALAVAVVICAVGVLVTIFRWYLLVRAQDLPFSLYDAIRLGMLGFFFNACLPGSVGGDLVKAAFLAREQSRRTQAVATVILDRIIGFAGLFWLAALLGGSLYISGALDSYMTEERTRWTFRTILLGACGICAATLVFWAVLGLLPAGRLDLLDARLRSMKKVGPAIAELIQAVRIYRRRSREVALALAMSVVSHFGFILVFYESAHFFTPAEKLPPLSAHLLLLPIGMTIQAGIPLPGGIGGAEFGYGTLYRLAGYRFADGVLGSLGQRLIFSVLGFVGYLIYLRMPGPVLTRTPPPEPAAEASSA